ncbi:TetR/AcrR family transcriptional regulator [Paucilactobacillus hokkaidonensis]|uniref:TetR/AcrR family transcriptional regulator n=1 Tax=Paucilactobacillus hokkaidonensis TaxID=1193095 RepID=UPI0006D0361A|nr:TetR/AcrR family transcriptional regulator [Paucilactobacillus hokkaidonensis]
MKIKDENKRQQILTATASIITHEGAAAVSTTKVAKQVGIGQSSLYTYFTNKQALLSAVFAQEQQKLASLIIGAGVADDTLTIKARLMRYAQTMVKFAIANPDSLVIIEQIKFLPDFNGPSLNDPQNPIVQLFQMAIDAGALPKLMLASILHQFCGGITTWRKYSAATIHRKRCHFIAGVAPDLWGRFY